MKFTFKIIAESSQNEWVGWFGDTVMKVRIAGPRELIFENFFLFLEKDLGIRRESFTIIHSDIQKRLIMLEMPDVAWELFLSAVEK